MAGGQLLVALGYAISPIVLYLFIRLVDRGKFLLRDIVSSALLLSLQIMFDIRMGYITLAAVGLYILYVLIVDKRYLVVEGLSLALSLVVVGIIVVLMNAIWLLPMMFAHINPLQELGGAFTTKNAVKFFSFAQLENSMSLLHPNWPENLFGKVYFMRFEFVIVPLLSFSSLLFLKKTEAQERRYILFFALLGLVGSFLGKGANDPFGSVYQWLFDHVPGFIMFRDPTKWYLMTALSYLVLISFTVKKLPEQIDYLVKKKIGRFHFKTMFFVIVCAILLFLTRQAWTGQLTGTTRVSQLPQDYQEFATTLTDEDSFSRTMWVPSVQRFALRSYSHPALAADQFFNVYTLAKLLKTFHNVNTLHALQVASVKYIVVPDDTKGEIFLKDRKYDEQLYQKTVDSLRSVPWLKEVSGYGKLKVFEVPNPKDHIWSTSQQTKVSYTNVNPTLYTMKVSNAKVGDRIIFSEQYDPQWQLSNPKITLSSQQYKMNYNSFIIPTSGNISFDLVYKPQQWVDQGLLVTVITMVVIAIYFVVSFWSIFDRHLMSRK